MRLEDLQTGAALRGVLPDALVRSSSLCRSRAILATEGRHDVEDQSGPPAAGPGEGRQSLRRRRGILFGP